jgi:molybdopterin converting factor small subunit
MATVRYFAAAADAAGTASEVVEGATLGALLAQLSAEHGAGFERVLGRCSVLVDGRASADPATAIGPAATVDVLPPFAGG